MVSTEMLARILFLYVPIILVVSWGLWAKRLYWPEAVTVVIGGISSWTGFMVRGNGEAMPLGRLPFLAVAWYCLLKLLLMYLAPIRAKRLRELFALEAEAWRKAKVMAVEVIIEVVVFLLSKLFFLAEALSAIKLRRHRKATG